MHAKSAAPLVGVASDVTEFSTAVDKLLDIVAQAPLAPLSPSPAHPSSPSRGTAGGSNKSKESLSPLPNQTTTLSERIEFFTNASRSLGRTALCLSGGGSLAMYHLGIVRALLRAKLLPDIITGSSGGSIIAGMLALKTDVEMLEHICIPKVTSCSLLLSFLPSFLPSFLRFFPSFLSFVSFLPSSPYLSLIPTLPQLPP